jgi:hypothetical protein
MGGAFAGAGGMVDGCSAGGLGAGGRCDCSGDRRSTEVRDAPDDPSKGGGCDEDTE